MACCSRRVIQRFGIGGSPAASVPPHSGMRRYSVQFEYVGKTALTALGPVSGKRYRFDYPGAIVAVDSGDRPGLAAVPNLRAV